jgi:hypothetical protein
MLIDEPSNVGGGETPNTEQKKIQDCIETARLVYKQLKPKPEKLKQSLFAAELEQDFEITAQEVKKKTRLTDDVEKLQHILSKTLKLCIKMD